LIALPNPDPSAITSAVPAPTAVVDAGLAVAVPGVADASSPPPTVVLTPSKAWPFYQWDKAQAYTYNLQRPGPGSTLRVYSKAQGWSKGLNPGPELSSAQAKKALKLLSKTQGELFVSKCAFPRHGIVLTQGGVPVGSISVCFECGDIMIWPAYKPSPEWQEQKSRRMGKLMKAYDRVFPQWESFFASDLGLATDWTQLAPSQGN